MNKFHFLENESLKGHCTFKIGGISRYFFQPESIEEFVELIQTLEKQNINYHIIGRGSNILFSDDMKTDCVITTLSLKNIRMKQNKVAVDCGTSLREFCYLCMNEGLSGMEGLSGIPGTVGGALYMNAGAYGYSIDQILETVEIFNLKNGNTVQLSNADCHFGYRKSIFMKDDFIILNATFKLQQNKSHQEIKRLMKELEKKREEKQPLNYPSAGSVFKRPYDTFYPAKEIQELGLKGCCIGDACVSDKHSGFIINIGQATSDDVKQLISYVQKRVYDKTNVLLSTEIKYLD